MKFSSYLLLSAAALLLSSCSYRLNEALSKLPQTEAYSKRLPHYTVQDVVTAAKPLYDQVLVTANTIQVVDGPTKSRFPGSGTMPAGQQTHTSVVVLGHNGSRLTGASSFNARSEFVYDR